MPASVGTIDPFALYFGFPACIYSTALSEKLDVVKLI